MKNSREIAELIWREAVAPAFQGPPDRMGITEDPERDMEPEDRENALRIIEHLLETHAGVEPDRELEKAREESEE